MNDHPDDVRDLHAFVLQRLDRRRQLARERGDDLARMFALGSRRVVEAMAQHLGDDAPAPAEVCGFLARAAYPYRRHPDFRSEWMLHACHAQGFGASPSPGGPSPSPPVEPDPSLDGPSTGARGVDVEPPTGWPTRPRPN